VAQGEGPEFKPQYSQNKKQKNEYEVGARPQSFKLRLCLVLALRLQGDT
jgi:hypothetical protein